MWRARHLDDRQRPVRLVRFGPASSINFTALRAAVASRATYLSVFAFAMLGSLIALTLKAGPLVLAVTLLSPVSSTLIVLVSITGVAVFAAMADRGERLANDMARAGRCPGCAYPFAGLEPEPDLCTVCPECGSAWNLAQRLAPPQTVVIPNPPPQQEGDAPKHDLNPYNLPEPIPSPPHARHPP